MPVPKRRLGRTRIHHRRSAWARKLGTTPTLQQCPACGAAKLPHRVCPACGAYDGRQVLEIDQQVEE